MKTEQVEIAITADPKPMLRAVLDAYDVLIASLTAARESLVDALAKAEGE